MNAVAGSLQDIEARRGKLLARLDLLTSRDRELSRMIGKKVADGAKAPPKMRDERRDLRDELEDLTAALPVLDREAEAAQTAHTAAELAEKQARLSAVKSEAADLGRELREVWEPVARIVKEANALDPVYRAASKAATGRGDDPVAEPMGVPLSILMGLTDLQSRMEAV